MKQTRTQRKAAEQAEYEASLRRAEEATQEQRDRPTALWPMLGLIGLAVDSAKPKATPPRPDIS